MPLPSIRFRAPRALPRRLALTLVGGALVACSDARSPAAPPAPPPNPAPGGVQVMVVSLPRCAASVTSSAGTCLPHASHPYSHAYELWKPDGRTDTCPANLHDAYWTLGPDGKVYPTWHPPTQPDGPGAGCGFGHEHGRDPSGSRLASWGLPFGYVNEQHAPGDVTSQRHEDHVGHKVDWANDWTFTGTRNGEQVTLKGDLLVKIHQGTHSGDALRNNLHEVFYYLKLEDGAELRLRFLNAFGPGGSFRVECQNNDPRGQKLVIPVGTATPGNSPTTGAGGNRIIPSTTGCPLLVAEGERTNFRTLLESWQMGGGFRSAALDPVTRSRAMRVGISPYLQVLDPSRVHTPDATKEFSLPTVELCYATGALQVRGEKACDDARALGRLEQVDPRSPFRGAVRRLDVGNLGWTNTTTTQVWYTIAINNEHREGWPDALPQPDRATGRVIEQRIPVGRYTLNGGVFPVRDHGGAHKVHAPN